jgi:predicted transposase/invertase (TIGR01784 family)
MRRTLDPTHDVVFSLLFGEERNKDVLIALLNAVLEPPSPIVDVEILPLRPERFEVDGKSIVLDVRARLASGEQVDIEMQNQGRPGARKRVLYYWSRLFGGQLERGEDYTTLKRCIVIVIANHRMLESRRFHSIFRVKEQSSAEELCDDLEIHVLELRNLQRGLIENEGRAAQLWGKFLTAETDLELEQIAMEEPALKRAKEALDALSADPRARLIVEREESARLLEKMHRTLEREEDRTEARAEGLAEGKVEGKAHAILTVLRARGIAVPADIEERILSCKDLPTLERWLQQAVTTQDADELLP